MTGDIDITADGEIVVPEFDPVQAMLDHAEYEAMRRYLEEAIAKACTIGVPTPKLIADSLSRAAKETLAPDFEVVDASISDDQRLSLTVIDRRPKFFYTFTLPA